MPNRFSVVAAKAVVAEKSQNLADAAKPSSRLRRVSLLNDMVGRTSAIETRSCVNTASRPGESCSQVRRCAEGVCGHDTNVFIAQAKDPCGEVFRVLPADTHDRVSVVLCNLGRANEALPLRFQHGQGQRDHRSVELWQPLAVGVLVLFLRRLNRVFDGLKGSDLSVVKLAANL